MPNSSIPLPDKSPDSIAETKIINPAADFVKSAPFTLSTRGFSELNKIIRLINTFDDDARTDINLITGCALTTTSLLKQTIILKQDTRFIARIFPNGHIEWQAYTGDISELFNKELANTVAEKFLSILNPQPDISKQIDNDSLESAMNDLFMF